MEVTIMKPAVMEPSHIPRIRRTAKSPPKLLHAACEHRAMAQTKMFVLDPCKWIATDVRKSR